MQSQNANDLHELLFFSGLARAIMALLCIALGRLIAGRMLRPLRTITRFAVDSGMLDCSLVL